MNPLAFIESIVGDGLLFISTMAVLAVVSLITISRLPPDNPLRRMLYAVSVRIAVTLGVGAVAVPVQPILGLDAVYDVVAFSGLLYFWLTLIRVVMRVLADRRRAPVAPLRIEQDAPPAITGQARVAVRHLSERTDKEPMRLRR